MSRDMRISFGIIGEFWNGNNARIIGTNWIAMTSLHHVINRVRMVISTNMAA